MRYTRAGIIKAVVAPTIYSVLIVFLYFNPDQGIAQTSGLAFEDVLNKYPELPWQLRADTVSYDSSADIYIAEGQVEISKADKILTADYVRFDHTTMNVYAWGNVMFISGQDVLQGNSIFIDLVNQVGTVQDGSIFLKENNFHVQADRIRKTGADTYEMEQATITTCDGDKPDWKITGQDVKVTVEGAGTATHATLWARDIPVLYTPYFYYPVKTKRQTGLLFPEFGYSERKGAGYNQPFFWAISDSQDATVYAHYMSLRGIKPGGEYRYILDESSQGAIMLDGFYDRKVDDGQDDHSKEFGFDDPDEQLLRTNHDRWWLRMSHHQQGPWDLGAKLDLDLVSDQDYLREFQDGFMGFSDSQNYFVKNFRRPLDDYNDPVRLNRLNANKIWSNWSFNTELRYFWDSTQRNSDEPDETLSRLPAVDLQAFKQRLPNSPLYFNLDSSYNYFWRPSGFRGQRIDVHPRLYWPYSFRNYFTFEPSVGGRETFYYLDKTEQGNESDPDETAHREILDTRLNLFSEVHKIVEIDAAGIDKIKHRFRPEIRYDFIPDVNQKNLPNFDGTDRIDETSLLSYSITNTLTSKALKGIDSRRFEDDGPPSRDDMREPARNAYEDFCRLKIAQRYDFKKSNRPFSPIEAKLGLWPGEYVSIDASAGWSVYDNEFVSHNIEAAIWDKRGDRLYVDYRYNKDIFGDTEAVKTADVTDDDNKVESIFARLNLKVNNRLSVFGEYERNIRENINIRSAAGVTYSRQCWSFDFRYVDTPNDEKVEFKINLYGLGEVGY